MEIPVEVKRIIIARQADTWKQSQYDILIALRVAKKIGDGEERIDQLTKEAERCEKAIAALEEELKAL